MTSCWTAYLLFLKVTQSQSHIDNESYICHVNCPNYKNHFHRVVYNVKMLNSLQADFLLCLRKERYAVRQFDIECHSGVTWLSHMWPSLWQPKHVTCEHDRLLDTASTSCPPLAINPHPVPPFLWQWHLTNDSGAWLPPLTWDSHHWTTAPSSDFSGIKEPEWIGPQTWPENFTGLDSQMAVERHVHALGHGSQCWYPGATTHMPPGWICDKHEQAQAHMNFFRISMTWLFF